MLPSLNDQLNRKIKKLSFEDKESLGQYKYKYQVGKIGGPI